MSGNLLHVNATVICSHGGQAGSQPAQSRVVVAGQPVATVADFYTVTGCPFAAGNKPQPCVTVRWLAPSGRIQVNGSPALLQSTPATCQSAEQVPQGPPRVTTVQQRVVGQ
jgi:hypothetical protein